MSSGQAAAPTRWQGLAAAWRRRDARERRLLLLGAGVLALYLLWALALQPALRRLRDAPARIDRLDVQMQTMQQQASEAQALRAAPPIPPPQARAALQAATAQLGGKARLVEQGERAVLTLDGASSQELQAWLNEVRVGARARVVELRLRQQPQGLSGTVIVALPQG